MCVGKNTSQPANVGNVRPRRTFHALQRAAAFSKKWLSHFFDTLKSPFANRQKGIILLVDLKGIEPSAFRLRTERSPS